MADAKNKKNADLGPVYAAAAAGKSAEEIRRLVEAGARTSGVFGQSGRTPLMEAVWDSDARAVRLLLDEAQVPVDERDPKTGETALHLCHNVRRGDEMMALLLDAGADANAIDGRGSTALFQCALYGRNDAARLLLARGASPDVATGQHGYTPLMFAARNFWIDGDPDAWVLVKELCHRSSDATRRQCRHGGLGFSALDDLVTGHSEKQDAGEYEEYEGEFDTHQHDRAVMEHVLGDEGGRRVLAELLASGAPIYPEHAAIALEVAGRLRKALGGKGRGGGAAARAARESLAALERGLREAQGRERKAWGGGGDGA